MSFDIQFISLVDDLAVVEVTEVEGAVPRTIRVLGEGGFTTTQAVEINDLRADSFVVVSDRVLLVEVPEQVGDITVGNMTVSVLSGDLTNTRKMRIIYGLTKVTRKIFGIEKLVQQVVKTLLSAVGSDRFYPTRGGGLVEGLSSSMSPKNSGPVATQVANAVRFTEEQVIATQAGVRELALNEKLMSLKLTGVQFDSATTEVRATVRLLTFAGQEVAIPLSL